MKKSSQLMRPPLARATSAWIDRFHLTSVDALRARIRWEPCTNQTAEHGGTILPGIVALLVCCVEQYEPRAVRITRGLGGVHDARTATQSL